MNCDIPNSKTMMMPKDDASTRVNPIVSSFTNIPILTHFVGQNWTSISSEDTTIVSKEKVS